MFLLFIPVLFLHSTSIVSSSRLPEMSHLQRVEQDTHKAFGGPEQYQKYRQERLKSFFRNRIEAARALAATLAASQVATRPRTRQGCKSANLERIDQLARPKVTRASLELPVVIKSSAQRIPADDLEELVERLSIPKRVLNRDKNGYKSKNK